MIVPNPREARPPAPISKSKLLLVEGDTDAHFFDAVAEHLGIADDIEIRMYHGKSKLRGFLQVVAQTREFESLVKTVGIVRDCDDNPDGTFRSVEDAVIAAQFSPAVTPKILLVPSRVQAGELETLLLESVKDSPIFDCIQAFEQCIARSTATLDDKGRAQVYIATTGDAQLFPGIAARRGVWPFASPALGEVIQFVRDL
jgi:hypothetical protein